MKIKDTIARRTELEAAIEQGLTTAHQGFYEIYREELYAPEYCSYRDYMRYEWSIGKSQAYRLLHFEEFLALSPNGETRKHLTEGAFRPLDKLKKDEHKRQAAKIVDELIQSGVSITSLVTAQIVKEIKPSPKGKKQDGPLSESNLKLLVGRSRELAELVKAFATKLGEASGSHDAVKVIKSITELSDVLDAVLVDLCAAKTESEAKRIVKLYLTKAIEENKCLGANQSLKKLAQIAESKTAIIEPVMSVQAQATVLTETVQKTTECLMDVKPPEKPQTVEKQEIIEAVSDPVETILSESGELGQEPPTIWDSQPDRRAESLGADIRRDGTTVFSETYRGAALPHSLLKLIVNLGSTFQATECLTPPLFSRSETSNTIVFERVLPTVLPEKIRAEIDLAVGFIIARGDLDALSRHFKDQILIAAPNWSREQQARNAA